MHPKLERVLTACVDRATGGIWKVERITPDGRAVLLDIVKARKRRRWLASSPNSPPAPGLG
jgi:hypothetical protein